MSYLANALSARHARACRAREYRITDVPGNEIRHIDANDSISLFPVTLSYESQRRIRSNTVDNNTDKPRIFSACCKSRDKSMP